MGFSEMEQNLIDKYSQKVDDEPNDNEYLLRQIKLLRKDIRSLVKIGKEMSKKLEKLVSLHTLVP